MSGKDDYASSAPPLGFDQAWIDNQLKNGSGVDLITAQILSQKTYDKWTGEGYGSIVGNAHAMAQRLANAGITRLEDFGRAPVYKPAEIMEWSLNGQPVYENRGHGFYTPDPKVTYIDPETGSPYHPNRYLSAAETQKIQPSKYGVPGTAYASDIYGDYAYDTIVPVSADKLKTVNGVPSYESGVGFVNKKTGKPVAGDAQSGTVFDKTFAGDGSTTFQVQFNDAGMPIFFSQYGGSSSDWGTVSSILSFASFIPGVGPFAAALNAVGNAYNGNTTGAVLSALSAAGQFGAQYGTIDPSSANAINGMDAASDAAAGVTATAGTSLANFFAQNAGAIQTAQQGVAVLNALDKGNLAGVISGLMNIAPQVGVTIPSEIIKPISAAATAAAISKGDWAGAMAAAGTLTDNPALRQDAKLANQAANVINAVKSGNPMSILSAGMGFAKQSELGGSTFKTLASSFGVDLDPEQLVAFENAAPGSAEFDAATHGLVKLYEDSVSSAKDEYKEQTGKDMPDAVLDALIETGDIAGSMEDLTAVLDGADEETKKQTFEQLGQGVDKAIEFADSQQTSVDEARAIMKDLGYTNPTDDEVKQFAGQLSEDASKTSAQDYVGQHTVTEAEARKYLTDLGYKPTDAEVKQFAKQGSDIMQGDIESQLGEYADTRMVDRAEAQQFFKDLGYTPTEEELNRFIRQGSSVSQDDVATEAGRLVDDKISFLAFRKLGLEKDSPAMKDFLEENRGKSLEEIDKAIYDRLDVLRKEIVETGGTQLSNNQLRNMINAATKPGAEEDIASYEDAISNVFDSTRGSKLLPSEIKPVEPPVVDEVLEPVLPDESVTQDELANIVNPPAEPAEPEVVEPTPTPVEPVGPPTQEEQQPSIDDLIKELEAGQPVTPEPEQTPSEPPVTPPVEPPKDPLEEILSKPQEEMTAEDWAKLYGTPTTNPETGETITGGDPAELPNQDLGTEPVVPDDFTGEGPAIWKPNADGTQTMTADDGSTITIDQDGNVVGSTEAPKGNLPGETPPVTPKPPVTPPKLPVTPPTTPTTPVAPAANTGNLAALLALLGGMGGQQQSAQQPVQENAADIKSFEEMGFGDLFGTELGLTAPQTKTVKAASGGSIDELLKLLRS